MTNINVICVGADGGRRHRGFWANATTGSGETWEEVQKKTPSGDILDPGHQVKLVPGNWPTVKGHQTCLEALKLLIFYGEKHVFFLSGLRPTNLCKSAKPGAAAVVCLAQTDRKPVFSEISLTIRADRPQEAVSREKAD